MRPRTRKLLRFASIACMVLAILWYLAALATDGWSHRPSLAWLRRLEQPTWKLYRDREFGFRIDVLSSWEVTRPPARSWTRREGDSLQSEDILVMRYHDPFTFVAIVRYQPGKGQRTVDWSKEAAGSGFVASGFGERIMRRTAVRRQGRAAWEVVALGPIRQHTYRFTSLFLPDGPAAWRVTAGVEARQYPRVAGTITRMLESFTLGRAASTAAAAREEQ